MDKDIIPELLASIQKDFELGVAQSETLKKALELLEAKKATYQNAHEYAIELGEILSKALRASVSSESLPDGKMYYNIAKRVLEETLGRNFDLVSQYAGAVQENLNEEAGIRLKVQQSILNQDRIDGFVNRLDSEENFDKVKWLLGEPIKTFSQSIVDDTLEKNAEFQYKAGLHPEIIRISTGKCCDWCQEIEGIYQYPKVPKDVYRRHDKCRCIVEYDPKTGKIQSVWNKIWRKNKESDKIESRKNKLLSKEFKPAKTINEANKFAEKLGFKADYSGIDIKCANEWNLGLFNAQKNFPEIASRIKFVGSSQVRNKLMREEATEYYREVFRSKGYSDSIVESYAKKYARKIVPNVGANNMASSISIEGISGLPNGLRERFEPFVGITMNNKYFNSYGRVLEDGLRQVEVKWHPVGCYNTKATFDHEFGHQIDAYLKAGENITIQREFNQRTREEITNDLSEYAWHNQNNNRYSEMIAEAWSEYCNNKNPREMATIIGKEIEQLWKNKSSN